MSKPMLCRTISPTGIMEFAKAPMKADYTRRPYTMQPEAYTDGGIFYCYNKGIAFTDIELNYKNVTTTERGLFQTFLTTQAIYKTHPFLFREPDGTVLVGRFTAPDGIRFTPQGPLYEAISGISIRCTDTAVHTSGSATLANTTIVLTDGAASVDFNAANILTDHLGMMIDVYDSQLRRITGFLKGAVSNGATIVNTPGGTTYNWLYKDTGFNISDAGGFTYKIYNEGI